MLNILRIIVSLFVLACFATAQIDAGQIPQACHSPCQKLLDLGNTCVVEYPQQGTKPKSTACLCNGLSSLDYSSCTTCLNSNAPTVAQGVSQLSGFCTQFINGCSYECSFDMCPSSDVQCQCKKSYLQGIYDCAFCNSGHGNTNATTLSDYTALSDSCSNQGQTATPTGVDPAPTPSGTIPYTGGDISVASISSGSYTTHTSTGTTSRASGYPTARTSGTSTGAASTIASPFAVSPSSFSGGARKSKSVGASVSGLVCLIVFASTSMAFGQWV